MGDALLQLFTIVISGLIAGYVGLKIAENKGRSSTEGFCLGFFVSIIGIIIELVLPDGDQKIARKGGRFLTLDGRNRQLRKCPFCAEMVLGEAKVCRYCSRDLPPYNPEPIFRSSMLFK